MATPTMKERRTLAKSGAAMPDGSFYIRNAGELSDAIKAVGRATPNAGESETARRNSVRRHIIRRARALNLTSMIPDTWNPDGSLKHSELEEWLMHHGVKGMHWGVHRKRQASSTRPSSPSGPGRKRPAGSGGVDMPIRVPKHVKKAAKFEAKAKHHEQMAKAHLQGAAHAKKEHEDLMKNGLQSAAFKRVFGEKAITENEWAFYGKNGMSKAEALRATANDLRRLHNQYMTSVNSHTKAAAHYRDKAKKLKHDDMYDGPDQDDLAIETEVFLAHYGVLGMKWGVRRRRSASASSSPRSPEAARAARLQTRAQTHGSHSLTNAELQQLVTRMNLENQYGRLNPKHVSTGKKVALGLLVAGGAVGATVAKQTAASFASKYAAQGVEALIKAAAAKKG